MRRAALFRNNKSQAVRIPRDMEFTDVNEVEIVKIGQNILLRPYGKKTREDLIAKFESVEPWPDDFEFRRPIVSRRVPLFDDVSEDENQ